MVSKEKFESSGADLLFRDLNQELQDCNLADWKRAGRTDLIKAVENGEDVIIRHYHAKQENDRVDA